MSISRQNLSIVIVTFKSDDVIHQCIKSIDEQIKIIVIENSNNGKFKEELEREYKNVRCYLASKNLGMGPGNNLGITKCDTDYILILNPDVILEGSTIENMLLASNKIPSFSILSPLSSNIDYPNYKKFDDEKETKNSEEPFRVKSVDGFAMLLNIKELEKLKDKKDMNIFDENFFMYLENDDLCKRIIDKQDNIYIVPDSKINHLGGRAVNSKYKVATEYSRNWHWMWSKFYFNKKHNGYLKAFIQGLPSFFSAILKTFFYFFINNKIKRNIYFYRASGYLNCLLGRTSWYRPKIDN